MCLHVSGLEVLRCRDSPTPLRSSELGPVEASIDDLSLMTSENLQVDAAPVNPANLEQKLAQELNYHKGGSYTRVEQPDLSQYSHSGPSSQASSNNRWGGDLPQQVSSVQSWTKPGSHPNTPDERCPYPSNLGPFGIQNRPDHESQMPGPSVQKQEPYKYQHYDRMQSWPYYPTPEFALQETSAGLHASAPQIFPPSEQGTNLDNQVVSQNIS